MKVSISWLKELVKINKPMGDLIQEINMKTIGTKEVTDKFIELDMKGYNRADLLSLRGVAYEVASLLDSEVKFSEPDKKDYVWVGKDLPTTPVKVEDEKLCPVYVVAKIEGLKVDKSPDNWVKKLSDSGIRSINNIADITNLIMLEYGQTIHSFDADKVTDETMIVRTAKTGEELITLDGKKRVLTNEDLLITDPKGILSLSGIMGGLDSEITDSTSSILLEVAIFNPASIRKSSQRLGLYSEASKRIQHGLTKKRLFQSLDAAIRKYQEIGGKLTALSIFDKFEDEEKEIKLRVEKSNSLIGLDFTEDEIKQLLKRLNFEVRTEKPRVLEVKRPYWRLDVSIEEDLIEEVARLYGYDKIPSKSLPGEEPEKVSQKDFEFVDLLKKTLMHLGLSEVRTYSFYSENVLNGLGFDEDKRKFLVKLANPISKETTYMRMNIWPNLVESSVFNNKTFPDVAIFEVGKTFLLGKEKPDEKTVLGMSLINGTDNPAMELLKIVEQTFESIGIEVDFKITKPLAIAGKLFHPLRFISIIYKDKQIGGIAELHPQVTDNFGSKKRIAVAEIDLEKLMNG